MTLFIEQLGEMTGEGGRHKARGWRLGHCSVDKESVHERHALSYRGALIYDI